MSIFRINEDRPRDSSFAMTWNGGKREVFDECPLEIENPDVTEEPFVNPCCGSGSTISEELLGQLIEVLSQEDCKFVGAC